MVYSEDTFLRDSNYPRYDHTNNYRLYNKKVKQCQCCSCILFLVVLSILLVLMLQYAIKKDDIDYDNVTLSTEPGILETSKSLKMGTGISREINDNSVEELKLALQWGVEQLKLKDEFDNSNPQVIIGSPEHKHQQTTKTYETVLEITRKGYIISKASQHFFSKHPEIKLEQNNIPIPLDNPWVKINYCNQHIDKICDTKIYRTIDGSCNNLENPKTWGVARRPFGRMVKPDYCDGVWTPRCGKNGTELPSARTVSIKLHRPEYQNDPHFNYMFAVWGQFIDHDISATALSRGKDGEFLSCCNLETKKRHPECFPIKIPDDDPYYSKENVTCMDFIRSAPAPTCTFRQREQLNQVSSYLDGSAVYGNTEELANDLRLFENGKLKMYHTSDGRDLLPVSIDPNDGCNQAGEIKRGRYCFLSGDGRANENLHLTTMHLIMARQHNFIATELNKINPHWNDEKLFQESRKIISAQIQHITYNEFLESLLGNDIMVKYRLKSDLNDYFNDYNQSVDATIVNAFAASAFRFAHTLLPRMIKSAASSEEYTEMHNILFNPFSLYNSENLDGLLEGAMNTNLEKSNRYFNKEISQRLFESNITIGKINKKLCGLDLVSLNLQRGRDHGIPGYVKWRELCKLRPVTSFDELKGIIDEESVNILSKLYKNVEDLDLYSGSLSEYPISNGLLGPTATCIIAEQFRRLKFGDRFWYENGKFPHSFSKDQLEEIRKTSLSRIICDNADNLNIVPPEIMKVNSPNNKRVNCNMLPEMNFTRWLDGNNESKEISKTIGANLDNVNRDQYFTEVNKITLKSSPVFGPTKDSSNKVVKLYFSATIIGGSINITKGNKNLQVFDGTLPTYLQVDDILTPNTWSSSATINWSGIVNDNTSIIGDLSMPIYGENKTINGLLNGSFHLNYVYKWGGNSDIIVPNKAYSCKILFSGGKKSTQNNVKNYLKKTEELTDETCTIMLGGSFYEPTFLCTLFPWWCTNEKLYYWSGDIELNIRKPITPTDEIKLMNSLKLNHYISSDDYNFRYIFSGKINSGWLKFDDGPRINVPISLKVPTYFDTQFNEITNLHMNIFGREIQWYSNYFHNSLYGTFNFPYYFNPDLVYRKYGKFYLTLDSFPKIPLNGLIASGIIYSTYIHLHDPHDSDFNKNPWNTNVPINTVTNDVSGRIILIGKHFKNSNSFLWDGNFTIILDKIPIN